MSNPFTTHPRFIARLPRLIRVYILNCLIGFGISAAMTFAILWFDVANARHLVTAVNGGWLAVFAFFLMNGTVFAGVQFAIAIMTMSYDDDRSGGKTLRLPRGDRPAEPALVRVRNR